MYDSLYLASKHASFKLRLFNLILAHEKHLSKQKHMSLLSLMVHLEVTIQILFVALVAFIILYAFGCSLATLRGIATVSVTSGLPLVTGR